MSLFYIGFFGILGVFCRYFLGLFMHKIFISPFPYSTFFINIIGSFVIGIIYVLGVEKLQISHELRLGLMVGFLGGFTTFSSYCLEAIKLMEESKYFYALSYLFLSPFVGIILTFLGIFLARKIFI
ncbi:fluoride efflux transporter CrcB [Fluviispira multicolorata]|uniref:Fluoride-specific ion channel FluC n=1 Tax=Fluviispira multicolorata TaxID=2654512 RepID=A0A833JEX3_9BACT|nr:fluoride efflux transporter CrcB [Fluviispira multicolorata]KAB8033426.1 fluoride efflux transporter CrcB [Fluviispira multicolorata]